MKITASLLALVAGATLAACSSSSSTPASSTGAAGDPCLALAGKPVGAEVDPTSPDGGHLATPPADCARAAVLSSLAGCYPSGDRVGDWFWYTTDAGSIVGKPGGKWTVKHGQVDRIRDAVLVGC